MAKPTSTASRLLGACLAAAVMAGLAWTYWQFFHLDAVREAMGNFVSGLLNTASKSSAQADCENPSVAREAKALLIGQTDAPDWKKDRIDSTIDLVITNQAGDETGRHIHCTGLFKISQEAYASALTRLPQDQHGAWEAAAAQEDADGGTSFRGDFDVLVNADDPSLFRILFTSGESLTALHNLRARAQRILEGHI